MVKQGDTSKTSGPLVQMGFIDPNSNGFLFTDHAITQKPFDYETMPTRYVCGVCGNLTDSVSRVRRVFDITDACAGCVAKIKEGREQIANRRKG